MEDLNNKRAKARILTHLTQPNGILSRGDQTETVETLIKDLRY